MLYGMLVSRFVLQSLSDKKKFVNTVPFYLQFWNRLRLQYLKVDTKQYRTSPARSEAKKAKANWRRIQFRHLIYNTILINPNRVRKFRTWVPKAYYGCRIVWGLCWRRNICREIYWKCWLCVISEKRTYLLCQISRRTVKIFPLLRIRWRAIIIAWRF